MKRTSVLISVALVLAVSLLITIFAWEPVLREGRHTDLPQAEGQGGGEFVLHSVKGPVALKDFRGKVVVMYFGYTWCPDICPTSLALLGQALHSLKPAELERVQAIFVSVDPERDSKERLEEYTAYFHPNLIGVTGTPEEVAEVAKLFGVAYRKTPGTSPSDYVVDHSSITYLINSQGQLEVRLPHGTLPPQIVAAIRGQLSSPPGNNP